MKRLHVSTAALLVGLTPLAAFAQNTTALSPIVLSGGFTPIPVASYGRAFSVITAEDLAERGIVTVQDALRALPGVAVNSTGDTYTQIRIRGGEGNHVLVLIDGVEMNSTGSGEYIFRGLEVANIERIEVLRGPQSTLYGSNAMSGVISITTKRAQPATLNYGGGLEFGSNGTRAGDLFLRQGGERGELSFSAGARHDGGYVNAREGSRKAPNDRETLNLTGEYRLTDTVTTGFTLRRTWQDDYFNETIAWGTPITGPEGYLLDTLTNLEVNELFGSLWLEGKALDGRLNNRLTASYSDQDSFGTQSNASTYSDAGTRQTLKYLASYGIDGAADSARHRLNFAAEHRGETYRNSWAPGGDYERTTNSLALEYQGQLDSGLDLQGGLRHDFNDVFKDATTWNIAFSYQLAGQDVRLRGSAGKAIVNPTMFEQFGWVPGVFEGNPDLRPESNLGADIGADIGFAGGRGEFGISLFVNNVKDQIAGTGNTSVNLPGTSKRNGVELTLGYDATDWLHLAGTYTHTDAKSEAGVIQVRRPKHELGLTATARTFGGRGTVTADLRHVAGNYDFEWWRSVSPAPITELPDFTTVNLAATYDLNDTVQLTGRVINLFDTEYSEAWGYYGQDRTAYIGVQAKW